MQGGCSMQGGCRGSEVLKEGVGRIGEGWGGGIGTSTPLVIVRSR